MNVAGWLERARLRWEGTGARDRRALLLGGAVLLPAVLWAGAVSPYLGALDAARSRLAAERALLGREESLLAVGDELPLRLARAETATTGYADRLIPASNRPLAEAALSLALEEVASYSRVLLVEIRGVEDASVDPPAGIAAVQVSVRGETDVGGLTRFLHAVETSPLLMRIRALEVTPRVGGSRNDDGPPPEEMGVVAFSMVVEAYASAHIDQGGAAAGEDPATHLPREGGSP